MAKVKCEPAFTQFDKVNVRDARKLTVDGAEVETINPDHFTTPIQASYDSSNSFSMTGNQTEDFQIGRRVQLDSGQSDLTCNKPIFDLTPDDIYTVNKYDYSIISGVSFDGAITDVTIADNIVTTKLEEVSVDINWSSSQAGLITTTDLINSSQGYPSDFVLETSGFYSSGDGGGAKWKQNGVIAQTPSQSPGDLIDPFVNDANGNQWAYIPENDEITFSSMGCLMDAVLDSNNDLISGTDDWAPAKTALKAAGELGIGTITHDGGPMYSSDLLKIYSNTRLRGSSAGRSIIVSPLVQSMRNENWGSTTDVSENIIIEGIGFTPANSPLSPISMRAISGFTMRDCRVFGVGDDGSGDVTVSVGISSQNSLASGKIKIINNEIQSNDYCIVIASTNSANGGVSDVVIEGNTLKTGWGSCVSIDGGVKDINIANNSMEITGEGGSLAPLIRGLGIKLWRGTSVTHRPENIVITGNTIYGTTTKGEIKALTMGGYSENIAMSSNIIYNVDIGIEHNFTTGSFNHNYGNNIFEDIRIALLADTASDSGPNFSNNKIEDAEVGCFCSLRSGSITGNTFKNISGDAIQLQSSTEAGVISCNTFLNIGESAVNMTIDSASTANMSICSNTFRDVSQNTNGGFPVLNLNLRSHNITGNTFWTNSTNKPNYIIAGLGTNRLISSNWMFGATIDYVEAIDGSDVYASNKERGL